MRRGLFIFVLCSFPWILILIRWKICDGPIKMVVFGCWENKIIVIGRRSKVEWKVRECLDGSEVVDDRCWFPKKLSKSTMYLLRLRSKPQNNPYTICQNLITTYTKFQPLLFLNMFLFFLLWKTKKVFQNPFQTEL